MGQCVPYQLLCFGPDQFTRNTGASRQLRGLYPRPRMWEVAGRDWMIARWTGHGG